MTPTLEALTVTGALAALAALTRAVRVSAVPGGMLVGTLIYLGGGRGSFLLLVAFFVLGVTVTRLGYREKAARGLAEPNEGRRGSAHALANGGVATLLAVAGLVWPSFAPLVPVGIAGALAAALADTAGSEVGQLYGRRTVSPVTFRPVAPGTQGAVSLEGTVAGVVAAALIALLGLPLGLYGGAGATSALLGGICGSMIESVVGSLGVTRRVGHMALNLGNTAVGATIATLVLIGWGAR